MNASLPCLFLIVLSGLSRADEAGPPSPGGAPAAAPKALAIMVDGLRADAVANGDMPNVRALMDGTWWPGYGGAWSLAASTIRDAMTESAPNHVSIATGLSGARHGIGSNADLLDGRLRYGAIRGEPCPTWLSRLAAARPGTKPLFVFSWYADVMVAPDYRVPFLYDRDAANAEHLAGILSRPGAPDAILWFIDAPDHAGHGHGFQPYSPEYLAAVADADRWIGRALDAIAARQTFAEEDWLVLVTADHGGWRRYHGQMNAQAFTIPFVVAGRTLAPGEIVPPPRNLDVAPTVLAHFGIKNLDGLDGLPVQDRLTNRDHPDHPDHPNHPVAHFAFDSPEPSVELHGAAQLVPEGGARGGFLRIPASTNAASFARLAGTEALAFPDGAFTIAFRVRTFGPQTGDPVALSNKDWNSGTNAGVAFVAARRNDLAKTAGCTDEERRTGAPGFAVNVGRRGAANRQDVGTYDSPPGAWVLYAATCGADGVLRFYQGHPDGRLYCIADDASGAIPASGLPFCVGQDGTGRYRHGFVGDIDELSVWDRALDPLELSAAPPHNPPRSRTSSP